MTFPSDVPSFEPEQLLSWAIQQFGQRFAVVTSFQKEGMVLVHMAVQIFPKVRVLTIDTGRMPEETYAMMETVRQRYNISVETLTPDATETSRLVTLHGPNLFRQSGALRKLCCEVRKVRPLARKMTELDAFAVGLRRGQSEERANVEKVANDGPRLKLSPLADWDEEQIEKYLIEHQVPVHPLYAQGYATVGCHCCTRAIQPGEALRAGRWWWENEGDKECGLHVTPKGQLKRELDVLLEEITAS